LQADAVRDAIVSYQRVGFPGAAPNTSLVCLENTHTRAGGTVMTAQETQAVSDVAHEFGASVHLDGARVFNAAAALGVRVSALTGPVDTVAVSLNKGLGAPFGAILAGSAQILATARLNLWRIGGASVQAGFLAAAGLLALTANKERVGDDNRRAAELGHRLGSVAGLRLDPATVESNIVIVNVSGTGSSAADFVTHLAKHGVLATLRAKDRVRFVTHHAIGDREVDAVVTASQVVVRDLLAKQPMAVA
jgi:threonine aldolase